MNLFCVIAILSLLTLIEAVGKEENETSGIFGDFSYQENATLLERWQHLEQNIKRLTNSAIRKVFPAFLKSGSANISNFCIRDTVRVISGVKEIKPWAMRFIDSSAKTVDGIMTGSMASFGAYDECLDTVVVNSRSVHGGRETFRGQYCMISIKPHLPPMTDSYMVDEGQPNMKNFSETVVSDLLSHAKAFQFLSFRVGICIPSSCTDEDVKQVIGQVGKSISMNIRLVKCEVKSEDIFSTLHVAVISAFSFAGLLMIAGSIIDIYSYNRGMIIKNKCAKFVVAFSFISNFRRFVDTQPSSETIGCLNGIRFLTMTWVVLGHTHLMVDFNVLLDMLKVRHQTEELAFQAVVNSSFCVDSFFTLSGLLVSYLTVKKVVIEKQTFRINIYIIHRLWRILPTYIYVILFVFLFDLLGSGPIWHETTQKYIQACKDNWWKNLLFVNNFYDTVNMCIPQSWYVASDLQLYLGALIVLLPLLRWPKVGISVCVICIIASISYCGITTYVQGYPPALLRTNSPDALNRYLAKFYYRPFVHVGPYCIGLLSGYFLATKKNLTLSKTKLIMGWLLAATTNLVVLYGVVDWNRGVEPSLWCGLLYASLSRTAWSTGLAWVIICCSTGHGGVVNYILSWKCFVPLGRLTFLVFLIHTITLKGALGFLRIQLQPDHFFMVIYFLGCLCIDYGAAFAGSMLIEAPMLALEKMIIGRTDERAHIDHHLGGSTATGKNGSKTVMVINDSNQSAFCIEPAKMTCTCKF